MDSRCKATVFAILAAALYAINVPLSKLLLIHVEPTMMAAFLYLGAGLGLLLYRRIDKTRVLAEQPLTRHELPYTLGMIVLDIAAPILLMLGLRQTSSANASLLNNFEIVATSLIAALVFHEVLSKRLLLAIALVTLSSIVLAFEGSGSFVFHTGSLLVLGACICWGLENNCTRMLSSKSATQITTIKGCFSGLGSLIIALLLGESWPGLIWCAGVMLLGFVAYGLSITFYIRAQKDLGAAKTSAYYSIAPFFGVAFSMLLLGERPGAQFYIALAIFLLATVLMVKDTITLQHTHPHSHVHCHEHRHGDLVHCHTHTHTHTHAHIHHTDQDEHKHPHNNMDSHDHSHAAPAAGHGGQPADI